MSILPQAIRQSLASLRQALLPCSSCLLCGADSGAEILCAACASELPSLPPQHCPCCALPTTHGERCGACLVAPPHFDTCHAVFSYQFPADRLIQALKYGHQLALAPWFAQRLALQMSAEANMLILPLPLHPSRLQERGFNQSGEIARVLGNCLDLPVDRKSLRRSRATARQAELPRQARHGNVKGAFECSRDFSHQNIILVDDVLTTGATANECARVLKLHGAARVDIAVIARALRH